MYTKMKIMFIVGLFSFTLMTAVGNAIAEGQRFSDVPLGHYAFEAVEWAAGAGVTAGYDDGTFRPLQALSKRHALVFMQRYFDEILQAEESEDFSRGDMMVVLKSINDGQARDSGSLRCRIRNAGADLELGFPARSSTPTSLGTLRVAVLFADFPNAKAEYSTAEEAERGLPYVESYLEASSYGKLDVEFTTLDSWIRLPHDHNHYTSLNAVGYQTVSGSVYETVIRLANPRFDFANQDTVLLVFPSALFSGGEAQLSRLQLVVDNVQFQSAALTNVFMPWWIEEKQEGFYKPSEPQFWGETAAHELLHVLGLPDYYSYESRWFPFLPDGFSYDTNRFGPLDLTVQSIHPDPEYGGLGVSTREMLAWSRLQLGWLDESQLHCITGDGYFNLSSLASLEPNEIGMLGIPLTDTSTAVVQSIKWTGFDELCDLKQFQQSEHIRSCNERASGPEGVLVYVVDASIPNGGRPLRLVGEDSDGVVHWNPLLVKGQGVVVGGYEIEVTGDNDRGHDVRITRVN